jgi:hypothetical protein
MKDNQSSWHVWDKANVDWCYYQLQMGVTAVQNIFEALNILVPTNTSFFLLNARP